MTKRLESVKIISKNSLLATAIIGFFMVGHEVSADDFTLNTTVLSDGKAVDSAKVSLWASLPGQAATQVAAGATDSSGSVAFRDVEDLVDFNGKLTKNVEPFPKILVTHTFPLCPSSINFLDKYNPKPTPPVFLFPV